MKGRLIFKRTPVSGDSCSKCGLKDLFNSAEGCNHSSVYGCDISYNFKLIEEEPVKLQYDHNKDRYDLINKITGLSRLNFKDEIMELEKYLKDNKPTNYQTCTKKNTKVGDEVRHPQDINSKMIIEHIVRESDYCSVWYPEDKRTVFNFDLNSLEINTYKDKE